MHCENVRRKKINSCGCLAIINIISHLFEIFHLITSTWITMGCELMSDAVCCYNGIVMKRFEMFSMERRGAPGGNRYLLGVR